MLAELLDSWSKLNLPDNCDVFFLVVENDTVRRVHAPASLPTAEGDRDVFYALEKEHGIPHARNRAVQIAVEQRADVLLFIDDDEIADPNWTKNLVQAFRASDASLLGGPVMPVPPADEPLNAWQRTVYEGVKSRYARMARKSERLVNQRKGNSVTVVTNNWLADVRIFSRYGLHFDTRLRFTGGSDAKLSNDVKALGLKVQWVPSAVVSETVPCDRLTFSYQYRRAKDQSNASFRRNLSKGGRSRYLGAIFSIPLKVGGAAALLLAYPFAGRSVLVPAVRSLGWVSGRLSVFMGKESSHYFVTSGF